ncbi:glycosyltransferase family 4 protein [Dysgonomonas sp. ZJ709]|uniref:glycosyltransferase family 4 protein n=1 Tax=Dysgonomonas sp. ZJ709 TaxID=2709797 RepID=UPI0013EBBC63|nr:glycosyltransferase family 4 protein [Dysgonomonas sp. ZJ709]
MNKSTKINFILPFKPRRPAGGFRVMYEYANRLAKKGYSVHLTYPIRTQYMEYRLPYVARYILSKVEGFRNDKWFNFDPSITMSYVPQVDDRYVVDADVVIATWWSTVLEMGRLGAAKGKKINLIQGFENWTGHEDLLYASYDMPDTTNVVVASYLKEIVEQHTSKPVALIYNAVNNKEFFVKDKIEERTLATVAMTYSIQEIKGSEYGLKALMLVKEKYPELQAYLFGVCPQPEGLPDWIKFYRAPDNLCDIYNRNAIFLSNSFTEGFPLTPAEALFCGCALICTDIAGHREFAIDGETALLVEVKNAEQMAERICYLIDNNEERISLAHRGNNYIQRFSWESAIEKMENLIKQIV